MTFVDKLLAASEDENLLPSVLRAWMRRAALRLKDEENERDLEIIARHLCRKNGHRPNDLADDGRPLWMTYVALAEQLLEEEDDLIDTAIDDVNKTEGSE